MIAEQRYGEGSREALFLKAAVPGANTQTTGWAAQTATAVGYEFISLVNQISVHGRLGLRPAPLNVNLAALTTGAVAYWRREGLPAPATRMTMTGDALEPLGVSALVAMSKELLQTGAAGAEQFIRAELIRAVVAAVDTAFLDPANTGTANVKPPSLFNGVTPITASVDTEYDLKQLVNGFPGDLETAFFVARPETYVSLHSFERPNIGARGGELLGIPAIASRHVPQPAGGEILALIDGQGIASGDDGVEVSLSDQASLEMLDASLQQTGQVGTGAAMVSMFQAHLVAMKVVRRLNWSVMRPSVSYIADLQIEETSA